MYGCTCRKYAASFFFQAEDGIRDGHVTGVQTCALPISRTLAGMTPLRSMLLFVLAALAEIGGAWLVWQGEIGRASCRERVEIWGGGVFIKEQKHQKDTTIGAKRNAREDREIRRLARPHQ